MQTPTTELYYSIVFLSGDEAHDAFVLLNESTEAVLLAYLQAWDFGGESEHSPTPIPWGTGDRLIRSGDYVISYNTKLGYIGLNRRAT